jgi:hypothetical protein
MVIHGQTVITGSFKVRKQAEDSNAENLLVINARELATQFPRTQRTIERTQKHTRGLSPEALTSLGCFVDNNHDHRFSPTGVYLHFHWVGFDPIDGGGTHLG